MGNAQIYVGSGYNLYSTSCSGTGGSYSVALGESCVAPGAASVSLGFYCYSTGQFSVALGGGNTANGSSSLATCLNTYAMGAASFSTGQATYANGTVSAAFGYTTKANAFADVAIGQYNIGAVNTANSGATTWWPGTGTIAADPVFEIGNGTSTSALADAFVVYKNGNAQLGGAFQSHGTVRCAAGGDLSMGAFTAGTPP